MEPRIRDEKQVSLLNLRSSFNLSALATRQAWSRVNAPVNFEWSPLAKRLSTHS
jgi:hypothetical protein